MIEQINQFKELSSSFQQIASNLIPLFEKELLNVRTDEEIKDNINNIKILEKEEEEQIKSIINEINGLNVMKDSILKCDVQIIQLKEDYDKRRTEMELARQKIQLSLQQVMEQDTEQLINQIKELSSNIKQGLNDFYKLQNDVDKIVIEYQKNELLQNKLSHEYYIRLKNTEQLINIHQQTIGRVVSIFNLFFICLPIEEAKKDVRRIKKIQSKKQKIHESWLEEIKKIIF